MSEKKYSASLLDFIEPQAALAKEVQSIEDTHENSITYTDTSKNQESEVQTKKTMKTKPLQRVGKNETGTRKKYARKEKVAKLMKIGEVAKLFNINTSVLRFWENTFDELDPTRTETGQRLYKEEDVLLVKKLVKLLHDDKLTIEGAKKAINKKSQTKTKLPKATREPIAAISLESKPAVQNLDNQKSPLSSENTNKFDPALLENIAQELEQIKQILNK